MLLSLGENTHAIPLSMYKGNRSRVVSGLKDTKKVRNENSSYVILKGGTEDEFGFFETDTLKTPFRQVSLTS